MMKRLRGQRGAALLETAITLPMILLVSVSIFEFGRAYQTWQVLTNASREGARLAVIEGSTDTNVKARVNEYLTGGGLASQPDSNIQITRNVTLTASGKGTQVQLNYPFQFMVLNPVIRLIAPSDNTGRGIYTMTASSVMRNE